MARWFVAGAAGMLGQDLCAVLEAAGHEVTRADLPGLDILDPGQCAAQVAGHDVVVNSAAYTAVDAAETDEARAFAVNAVGAANLARAATAAGATMVQLSTDYVVAGQRREPYPADAPVAPAIGLRSHQGRRRVGGARGVPPQLGRAHGLALRRRRPELPATMQRLAGERERLTVVADQVGQPTWTVDLAEGIVRIVDAGAPFGIWHATGVGECTWFELARAVFEELGLDPGGSSPITTDDFPLPAPRPPYSVLSHDMWVPPGSTPSRTGATPCAGRPRPCWAPEPAPRAPASLRCWLPGDIQECGPGVRERVRAAQARPRGQEVFQVLAGRA